MELQLGIGIDGRHKIPIVTYSSFVGLTIHGETKAQLSASKQSTTSTQINILFAIFLSIYQAE